MAKKPKTHEIQILPHGQVVCGGSFCSTWIMADAACSGCTLLEFLSWCKRSKHFRTFCLKTCLLQSVHFNIPNCRIIINTKNHFCFLTKK